MTKSIALVVAILALVAAWRWSPLAELADREALLEQARALRDHGVASLLAPFVFVALSLVLFPLFVLRFTTVVVFGPILGAVYAIAGVALCAVVGHAIGARLGGRAIARLGEHRIERIRAFTEQRRGILAVAALRLLPLGPFMVVNAAAGAARLRRDHFVLGTVIGLMPGLVVVVVVSASLGA